MTLTILIISPLLPATGNTSTVHRLQYHFQRQGFNVLLICSFDVLKKNKKCPVNYLNSFIKKSNIDAALLLHAVKSGSCVLCSCQNNCQLLINYGVIFGGTDINEDVNDKQKFEIMQKCLKSAVFSVTFNKYMHDIASKISAVVLHQHAQALDYFVFDYCKKKFIFQNICSTYIFVLPCSIRPVKDPMFVIDKFSSLRTLLEKDIRLLILGPITDVEYGQKFFDKLCSLTPQSNSLDRNTFKEKPYPVPNISTCESMDNNSLLHSWVSDSNGSFVQYIPAIEQKDYFNCLSAGKFFAVINTSISEGMSSVLLEAMAFSVPILAKNISGNRSVIVDGKTGLLFSTADNFLQQAVCLLTNKKLKLQLVTAAHDYVLKHHSPYTEAEFYSSLISQYFVF